MLTKKQILDTVSGLSESVSLDEIIDKLVFIEKINISLKQSEQGMICSEEDAKQRLSEWLE